MERLLYAALLGVAAAVRFFHLASAPLTPAEAAAAWPAWVGAAGATVANLPTPVSALLYSCQRVTFWLLGSGDGLARLGPVLAGTAMVMLPWYLRRQLGRSGALALAIMWTLDPWLLLYSRTGDGAIITVFLAMVILVGLVRIRELGEDGSGSDQLARWWAGVAVAAGFFLVSGALAWSLLPVLALFYLLFSRGRRLSPQLSASALLKPTFLVLVGAAAILGGSGWLSHLESLGYVGVGAGSWGQQFTAPSEGIPILWVAMRLISDQAFVLTFGLAGLFLAWYPASEAQDRRGGESRAGPWHIFLLAWILWALLLLLAPGRTPESLLVLVLPLHVAAVWAVVALARQPWRDSRMREGALLAVILPPITVAGSLYLTAYSKFQTNEFGLNSLLSFVLILVLVLFFTWWSSWWMTWRVVAAFAGVVLGMTSISSAWQLSHQVMPLGAIGFFAQSGHPDVRQLARDVETLSAQRVGDGHEIPIQVQMLPTPDPLLGWYLRSMRNLRWVLAADAGETQMASSLVLLVQADGKEIPAADLPAGYIGSRYRVRSRWLPTQLGSGRERLRWFLLREIPPGIETSAVELWVPAAGTATLP